MNKLLAIIVVSAAPFLSSAWAAETTAAVAPASIKVTGQVLESMDVGSYTYIRIKTKDGETWAAVGKASVVKGAEVTIENATVMKDFESQTLKKTFATILFGSLAGANDAVAAAHAAAKAVDVESVNVPKATGANAHTVAEVVTQAATLKDKPVKVRGKIVKYNPDIMGKTWIHLRDGTGVGADNSNDVLVTSPGAAKLGDVVTVSGVLRTDQDFGSGYVYKVLIEASELAH